VRTLVATDLAAGPHTIDWNGQDDRGRQQAAGVYLVRLQSPDGVLVHKVALVK
jgi:flagellar hook assembly protein FlgD